MEAMGVPLRWAPLHCDARRRQVAPLWQSGSRLPFAYPSKGAERAHVLIAPSVSCPPRRFPPVQATAERDRLRAALAADAAERERLETAAAAAQAALEEARRCADDGARAHEAALADTREVCDSLTGGAP